MIIEFALAISFKLLQKVIEEKTKGRGGIEVTGRRGR